MNYTLKQMFALLSAPLSEEDVPDQRHNEAADDAIIAGLYSGKGIAFSELPGAAQRLFELSVNAFDSFVHAWMSELPIQAETIRFGREVLAAGSTAHKDASRRAAENAAADRGNAGTRIVLQAACKVRHEIDRLRGLLRFSPNDEGVYLARCEPDHYILPALGEHFALRFGDTPWTIIDEKRGLRIGRTIPVPAAGSAMKNAAAENTWEALWKQYHKTINNEDRNNPKLQRSFMPRRYQKYLPEL